MLDLTLTTAESYNQELLRTLLEHFFAADDVFTETDAFEPNKLRMSYGRLYRAWKQARLMMDPDFQKQEVKYVRPLQSGIIHKFNASQKIQNHCVETKPISFLGSLHMTPKEKKLLRNLINVLAES